MKFPVSKPDIREEDVEAVHAVLKEGMVSHRGKEVGIFEEEFAKYHEAKFGVSCNSGTNALYLALKALGIGPGDEVIVPEFTMIATAYAVSYTGAKPVFVDCDESLLMRDDLVNEAVTPRTKAIILTHVYGRKLKLGSNKSRLYIIEDSCEAIGVPIQGDVAVFSLFANKTITAGEGGIAITNDPVLAQRMRQLANMDFDPEHTFLHSQIAHNFRLTNMQAALALSQLRRLDEILLKRKKIEQWYDDYLHPEIQRSGERDVLWMYDVQVDYRDALLRKLSERGVETRLFFKPMSMQKPYLAPYHHLHAYRASTRGFYLPTHTALEERDVVEICQAVGDSMRVLREEGVRSDYRPGDN